MEKEMELDLFLTKYNHYYQKIILSVILAKSKNDSQWYCIFLKLILLREHDQITKDNLLIEDINHDYIQIKFSDFHITCIDNIMDQIIKNKSIKIDEIVYPFYRFPQINNLRLNSLVNIIDFDNNYQGYIGYYLTKSYPKDSFYSTLNDLSLKESDIGISDDEFHSIFEMNNNYFKHNMLYLIFPIFLKEITFSSNNYSKIYEIDNNLYNDIKIKFQTKKEILYDLIEIEENQQSKLIKVPNIDKDEELKFEIHHKEFGRLIYLKKRDLEYIPSDEEEPDKDILHEEVEMRSKFTTDFE